MRIVTKAFLRYLPRRRGLSILQVMGIACGVAAAVGMALSARAALSSFTQAVEFLKGRSTHSLERPAGPMDEDILAQLMRDPAVEAFAPMIDRRLRINGETVRLLGVDPFLDRAIRPELARSWFGQLSRAAPERALSFLLDPRSILLDSRLADQLGLKPGEQMETSRGNLRVTGTFLNPSSEPLILMDIAQAQKLFGLAGQL